MKRGGRHESLLAFRHAGAAGILTYFAVEAARLLRRLSGFFGLLR